MVVSINSPKGLRTKMPHNASRDRLSNQCASKKTLLEVIGSLEGSNTEIVEKSNTIFFPGEEAGKVYLIRRGVVRLSRIYESGEEVTVALLKENSLFGLSSLLTNHKSKISCHAYHAVAFTPVVMETAPAASVRNLIETGTTFGFLLFKGISNRILQAERMIETLANKDISSRLVSFLLILCRDFGVQGNEGTIINLRLSHQIIADTIGTTRVTITRILGELKSAGLLGFNRKQIMVFDPITLTKLLN